MTKKVKAKKRPSVPKKIKLPITYKMAKDLRTLRVPVPDVSLWMMLIQAQADMEYLLAILGRFDRNIIVPIPPAGTTLGASDVALLGPGMQLMNMADSDYPGNDEIPPPLAPGDCDPTPVDLPTQITVGEFTGILLHAYRRVKYVAEVLGGPQV
jgi:hypothetical protein